MSPRRKEVKFALGEKVWFEALDGIIAGTIASVSIYHDMHGTEIQYGVGPDSRSLAEGELHRTYRSAKRSRDLKKVDKKSLTIFAK